MEDLELIKVSELQELSGDLSLFHVFGFRSGVSGRVPLANLVGPEGKGVEIRISDTHIQWRNIGDVGWIDIISLASLQGDKGDTGKNNYEYYLEGTDDDPVLTPEEYALIVGSIPAAELQREANEDVRIADNITRVVLIINAEEATAEALSTLNAQLRSLQELLKAKITQVEIGTADINTLKIKGSSLHLEGEGAPNIIPDFIGQEYIKITSPKAIYKAAGVDSVSDWLQIN